MTPLLQVSGLKIEFPTRRGPFKAVDDISFEVGPGERLGLIGESGSGKSTIALSLMRLIKPPGRIAGGRALLETEAGSVDLLAATEDHMRALRSQVLTLKERPFVSVAQLSGMSGIEIVWNELLPLLLPWLGANFVNAFIAAVLAESGLSVLGLGPQRDMTLGMMIYWSQNYSAVLQNLWWWWLPPVLLLIIIFMALYLIHIGLDEVSNPRLRESA